MPKNNLRVKRYLEVHYYRLEPKNRSIPYLNMPNIFSRRLMIVR